MREFGFPLTFFVPSRAQELVKQFNANLTFDNLANPELPMTHENAYNWVAFCKKFGSHSFTKPPADMVKQTQDFYHNLGFHTAKHDVEEALTIMNETAIRSCFEGGMSRQPGYERSLWPVTLMSEPRWT
jgi:hypothetical protein